MNINFDEIRKEIAIELNVLLEKDDPILVSVTLNDLVLQRYAEILTEILTEHNLEHQKAFDASFKKTLLDLRTAYAKLVSDTGVELEERMSTGLMDATKDVVARHKKHLGEAWVQIDMARKTVMACAVLTVLCTIVTVWVLCNAAA